MADLNLHRDHNLGLARARKVALKWAEAGKQLDEALAKETAKAPRGAGEAPAKTPRKK